MLAHSFFIELSSKLLVTRTGIKAQTSSISASGFHGLFICFFLMRFNRCTLDSVERSLPFGLLVLFCFFVCLFFCCCFFFFVFFFFFFGPSSHTELFQITSCVFLCTRKLFLISVTTEVRRYVESFVCGFPGLLLNFYIHERKEITDLWVNHSLPPSPRTWVVKCEPTRREQLLKPC